MAGKHAQTLIEAASGVRDNGPAEVVTGPTGNRSGLSMHDGTASSLPTHRLSGWLISKWIEQLRPEFLLHFMDPTAQRRLGHVEPFGATGKTAFGRHGDKIAEMLHIVHDTPTVFVRTIMIFYAVISLEQMPRRMSAAKGFPDNGYREDGRRATRIAPILWKARRHAPGYQGRQSGRPRCT